MHCESNHLWRQHFAFAKCESRAGKYSNDAENQSLLQFSDRHYIELIVKYKGHEVKLFIVNYKNSNHQQILLTTNTKLNFNQAMKIYAIRWSIEVFFKEAKQHLGLGKCQSQNFNAQIANTTITCIRFIMLALRKRFSAHETIGGLFKDSQAEMLEMIVADKILKIIIDLLKKISQLQNLTIDKAIELLYQNPQLAKLLEMASNFGEKK
jgi:IS4 transposase